MKKEIRDLIISELLQRIEEIRRFEIKDRIPYIGFLIQEISGIPAIYVPLQDARYIMKIIGKEINLSDNCFFR
jgi:hypothetical protein